MHRPLVSCAGLLAVLFLGLATARAAINPAHFQRVASDVVRLREIARIVHEEKRDGDQVRRVTIVASAIAVHESRSIEVGETVVIDFTVNVSQRARAAKEHSDRQGTMPGPQFLGEPEPPQPDAKGEFWAHLAPAGGRLGNVNRHAGAVVGIGDYEFKGPVFVPVGGPYSFSPPM